MNQFCRSNQIPFIMSDSYGLFAWCFVDFGDHFVCFDKNGETEKQVFLGVSKFHYFRKTIIKISQGINVLGPNEAEVSTLDASLHDLGMFVVIFPSKLILKINRGW